jgi:hypothetical protein
MYGSILCFAVKKPYEPPFGYQVYKCILKLLLCYRKNGRWTFQVLRQRKRYGRLHNNATNDGVLLLVLLTRHMAITIRE